MRICCYVDVKWQKSCEPRPVVPGCRGIIAVPATLLSNHSGGGGGAGYRGGRGSDRRHSGPSNYGPAFYHDFGGSYGSGGYRGGRGRPFAGHRGGGGASNRWCSDRGGRGGTFARGGGRYDHNNNNSHRGGAGRGFDAAVARNRGPSGDEFPAKYYGNCDVRPARGAIGPTRPRGFYHTSSAPSFP